MKKVTELVDWKCDICGDVAVMTVDYPVQFSKEMFGSKYPVVLTEKIDLCEKCSNSVLRIEAIGHGGILGDNIYCLREVE